jgi:outer membrane phospholipase A
LLDDACSDIKSELGTSYTHEEWWQVQEICILKPT